MNRQIAQLFGLTIVLFALLVGFTSYWSVFDAKGLENNTSNRRQLIEEQKIPRGLILARDGRTQLAASTGQGRGERRTYVRRYPTGSLMAQPLGYSFIQNGRIGLEQYRNSDLAGQEDEFESILTGLQSRKREGADVVTNLDVEAQQTAYNALAGRKGAVVAVEPQTGKVRVLASDPVYDPNQIPRNFAAFNSDPDKPLLNRTTQELYPPGSTFKVVTAAAALDTGKVTPESIIDGASPQTFSGVPLANFGGENFGPISLTDALTNSVNTVFAQVGEKVGRSTLVDYMDRFGFGEDPKLDYPDGQMVASGIRNSSGRYVRGNDGFDVARVAIGQGGAEGEIQATPLQMALVAATVANGGTSDRSHRAQGRSRQGAHPARPAGASDEARDGRPADADDGARGRGGNGHERRARWHPGGRQDGHRRGRREPRADRSLVHRLCAARQSARGRRGGALTHHGPGRD
jgi:peptidoglycan glycosyltransferase